MSSQTEKPSLAPKETTFSHQLIDPGEQNTRHLEVGAWRQAGHMPAPVTPQAVLKKGKENIFHVTLQSEASSA